MTTSILAVAIVGLLAGLLVVALAARRMLHIASSNEVLIVSGRRQMLQDGTTVGYRSLSGGRVFLLPVIESIHRMDATNLVVELEVAAWSKGYIPMRIEVVANVRVARDQPLLARAATRLLSLSREELSQLAHDVVTEATASTVAALVPEQIVEERAKVQAEIATQVEEDLAAVGLVLDTLILRKIGDDVGYLDALAR